jgi:protoporphyrin/coproporphyrin ferrochelatase
MNNIGVLLVNLGTPSAPQVPAVKRYLREFLTDPKVIDLPNPWRSLLVNGLIIPARAKRSTHAYQQIWTQAGSPLLVHSQGLKNSLQHLLGQDYRVSLGMNYGQPSLAQALEELKNCHKIIVLPLFPQYSSAVTESILIKVKSFKTPPLEIIQDFYQHPAFIAALAKQIQTHIDACAPEVLLLSYHGLPMRQLYKTSGDVCKNHAQSPCPLMHAHNQNCYRAQCFATSKAVSENLKLNQTKIITSFQSRLGRLTWTQPYTEQVLIDLAGQGIKRIAIACPSFVTDCLETVEEIGIRAKKTWLQLGGEDFKLIPALNDDADWLKNIILPDRLA